MDFATTLGVVSTAVGLIGAAYAAFIWSRRIWSRTVGSRQALTRQLDGLACGVTVDYAVNLLGPPAFRRMINEVEELTWPTGHAWVAALIVNEALACFAITVTDPKFTYDCRHLSFGKLAIRLGRDFLAAAPTPTTTRGSLGARRFYIIDEHYFGNPGGYQDYWLAHNDLGVGDVDIAGSPVSTLFEGSQEEHDKAVERVRRGTIANTLAVGSMGADNLMNLWDQPGVDMDFVRTLHPRA